jgi:hypothetical protein
MSSFHEKWKSTFQCVWLRSKWHHFTQRLEAIVTDFAVESSSVHLRSTLNNNKSFTLLLADIVYMVQLCVVGVMGYRSLWFSHLAKGIHRAAHNTVGSHPAKFVFFFWFKAVLYDDHKCSEICCRKSLSNHFELELIPLLQRCLNVDKGMHCRWDSCLLFSALKLATEFADNL